jgi:hypothetical protein
MPAYTRERLAIDDHRVGHHGFKSIVANLKDAAAQHRADSRGSILAPVAQFKNFSEE